MKKPRGRHRKEQARERRIRAAFLRAWLHSPSYSGIVATRAEYEGAARAALRVQGFGRAVLTVTDGPGRVTLVVGHNVPPPVRQRLRDCLWRYVPACIVLDVATCPTEEEARTLLRILAAIDALVQREKPRGHRWRAVLHTSDAPASLNGTHVDTPHGNLLVHVVPIAVPGHMALMLDDQPEYTFRRPTAAVSP